MTFLVVLLGLMQQHMWLVSKHLLLGVYFNSFIPSVPGAPPTNVTLMDIDPAMLKVTYSEVPEQHRNGDVSGYVIRYSRANGNDPIIVNVTVANSSILEVNITGLAAFVNYSVQVAAFDSERKNGPFSAPVYGLSGQNSK